MFTLPVNKQPHPSLRRGMPGKRPVQRLWNLTLSIQAGVMCQNESWIPADDYKKPLHNQFQIEVRLGEKLLANAELGQAPLIINRDLDDSDLPTTELLTIQVSGKDETWPVDNNTHEMLKVALVIENIPLKFLLEELGKFTADSTGQEVRASEFMGQNGKFKLEIYTPIYVWLMDKRELLKF